MKGLLAFLVVTVGLAGATEARMHHPYRAHRIVPASQAPLNGFTQPAAAYSFRLLRSAYLGTGAAVRLRRASDNQEADIGFSGSNDFDTAAAAAFCAATSCFVKTWYDQSGNARNVTQAVAADQPEYIANCNGDKPCSRSALTFSRYLILGGITAATPLSLNAVAKQTARSTTACREVWYGAGNELSQSALADLIFLSNGVTSIEAPSAGLAWHSHTGVMNGASSVINVDGTETTGSVTPTLTGGNIVTVYNGGLGATCDVSEAVAWSGYALTAGERTALAQNQRDYWTPLPLDNFATPAAAYSFRKLKSTYSGPAVRLRRASDNAEADIPFLGFTGFTGAPIDTAAAAAHCAATNCTVVTWYDQSGNNRHLTQTTAANQPALQFDCQNGLPCARMTAGAQQMTNTSVTASTVMTLNAVARHTVRGVGGPYCTYIGWGNQTFQQHSDFDLVLLNAVGGINAAATYQNWHSHTGVVNGAGSLIRVDATETPNALTGSGGGWAYFTGANTETCDHVELIAWDNFAVVTSDRAALHVNQKSFWGF